MALRVDDSSAAGQKMRTGVHLPPMNPVNAYCPLKYFLPCAVLTAATRGISHGHAAAPRHPKAQHAGP